MLNDLFSDFVYLLLSTKHGSRHFMERAHRCGHGNSEIYGKISDHREASHWLYKIVVTRLNRYRRSILGGKLIIKILDAEASARNEIHGDLEGQDLIGDNPR
jgi:hypothetical protein